MDLQIKNKVYLVAGASRGLGFAIAQVLHDEGACVSIASRDEAAITAAAKELGDRAHPQVCDVRDGAAIQQWVNAAVEFYGRIDGLVVNAGGPPPGGFEDFNDDDWQGAFELTLLSGVRMIRAALPALRRSRGAVLTMTSVTVREPNDNLLLSNVMRSGVSSLAKSLSRTLAADGVRVNQLMPGLIDTDRVKSLVAGLAKAGEVDVETQRRTMEHGIPMGRFGEPPEFARAAAFLLSPAAAYINGATLAVDGGALHSVL